MAKKAKAEINIEDIELDETPVAPKKKGKKVEVTPETPTKKAKVAKEAPAKNKISKELPEGFITAEQVAEEFGKKGRDVRQVLRDNEFEKPESGRWAWSEKKDASTLKKLRSLLGGTAPKAKKEKVEAPVVEEAPKKKKKTTK